MGSNKKAGLTLKPTHPDNVGEVKKTHINFVNDAEKLSKTDFEKFYSSLVISFANYLYEMGINTAVEQVSMEYGGEEKARVEVGTVLMGWLAENEPSGTWNGMKVMEGTPFHKIIGNIIKKDIHGYGKKFEGLLQGKIVKLSNLSMKVGGVFSKKTTVTGKITGISDFIKDAEDELEDRMKETGKKFTKGVYFDFSGLDFGKLTILNECYDDDKYDDENWLMGKIPSENTLWAIGKTFTETVDNKCNGLVVLYSIVVE